eukprot:760713-Hanusia_phi.AAC.1
MFDDSNSVQTLPYPSTDNTISISLNANVLLGTECKIQITLSGFVGACIDAASVNSKVVPYVPGVSEITRTWDSSTSTLVLVIDPHSTVTGSDFLNLTMN